MAKLSQDDNDEVRAVNNKALQLQGNMVQANVVESVSFDGPDRRPPHELPPEVPGFADHDTELARLDELAEQPDRVGPIIISGPAGVGKTALALRWAHLNRAAFPDGDIYLDLGGRGPGAPVQPKDALAALLRSLGEHQKAEAPTLEERSAHFRSSVYGRRMLVLLDNAGDVGQARPLLPGDGASLVLLTSRDDLAGIAGDAPTIRLAARAMPQSPPVAGSPRNEEPGPADHPYDVFVSYAAEDADWVSDFVGHLSRRGVKAVHDVLLPGDRKAHTIARAIMDSKHGLLVFSRAAVDDGWILEEYEALLHRSAEAGQRFIPVVIDDVSLPLFAAIRHPCDFRGASASGYEHQIDRLLLALRPR